MNANLWGAVCLAGLCGGAACAQVSQSGTGTVTGHVICQDTQKPARFASVVLFGVPASMAPLPTPTSSDPKAMQAAINAQLESINSRTFVQTETGIDGSFTALNVPPGEYYVMATVAGYVQPRYLLQAAYDAGEDVTKGVPGIPVIQVSADRASETEISVGRGAAVEGHVLWDDGGPVNGANVQAEPTSHQHKDLPPQFSIMNIGIGLNQAVAVTDDRGRYRISGLAPGEYTVKATLQTNVQLSMQKGRFNINSLMGAMPLTVYAPGGFRKTDAKPVTLNTAEERTDEDIAYNLNGTHTVSGRVTSVEDHHGLNQGVVQLADANDKTFQRTAGLDADGNFTVTFVPSGTYTLSVHGGADTAPEDPKPTKGLTITMTQQKTLRRYESGKQQVLVADGDLTGQNLELKPMKTSASDNSGSGDDDGQGLVVFGTGH